MAKSPKISDIDNVTLSIKAAGKEIRDSYSVLSVEVNRQINRVATARVVLLLVQQGEEKKTFAASEADDFVPGKELEISAGYHAREATIFKGLIVHHAVKAPSGRPARIILECSDESVKMTLRRRSQYFKEKKDSEIFAKLIGDYGLKKKIDATAVKHEQLIQYQAVDWDFLVSRAEVNGLLVYTEDGTVHVEKPGTGGSAMLKFTYGRDIIGFEGALEARYQLPLVECEGWDPAQQNMATSKASEPAVSKGGDPDGKKMKAVLGLPEYNLKSTGPLEKNELKAWADAVLLKSRLTTPRGTLTVIGNEKLRINTLVELAGLGKRFNGPVLITSLRHRLEEGKWTTTLGFGLDAAWYREERAIAMRPAAGLLPPIQGLQNGTVKKIDADPAGEYRVQVDVPAIERTGDGIWARLSNFYGTNGQGVFFLPEVGDEVVLGFLNDDPRHAVILGMLYGKKMKAPYTADDKNSIKAIGTKAQLKLEFNDADKVMTIETPAGNKCILSDKDKSITLQDQNGNKVEMSNAGIAFNSAKDITIKAAGKITLQATQALDAKVSGGDLTLQGLNVSAKGQIGFSAQGSATAELKASGTTTVKGAIVMIN